MVDYWVNDEKKLEVLVLGQEESKDRREGRGKQSVVISEVDSWEGGGGGSSGETPVAPFHHK